MNGGQHPEMFDTPEPPDKPMPEASPTLEISNKGRSGLAAINQYLTNEKARIDRQLAIVVDATRAVIKYDADTVDGLPQHIRAHLIDRWRRNT